MGEQDGYPLQGGDAANLIHDALRRIGKQPFFVQFYSNMVDMSNQTGISLDTLASVFHSIVVRMEEDMRYELYAKFVHDLANYTRKPIVNDFEWLAYIFDREGSDDRT